MQWGGGCLLQGPGTTGTESRFLQESGGQVSLSTAPSLSFPIQANRLPPRLTYEAHLKARLKVQVPRGQRPFSSSSHPAAWAWPRLTHLGASIYTLGTYQVGQEGAARVL